MNMEEKKTAVNWSRVLLSAGDMEAGESIVRDQRKNLAVSFYRDIQRTRNLFSAPFPFNEEFDSLDGTASYFWYWLVDEIPGRLISENLRIRLYSDFCRTCLIPYKVLESIAGNIYEGFFNKPGAPDKKSFAGLPEKSRRFYIELCHLIPVELRNIGYEIVHPEEISEISETMAEGLARAIHSRYLYLTRKQVSQNEPENYLSWIHRQTEPGKTNSVNFDDLPEEIKRSNLDNAFHIPTKLLSIGFRIRPVRKGYQAAVLHLNDHEIENMARVEHIRWCWDKILNGWFFGKIRDDRKKLHPSIIPYDELPEPEKDKDRELVRLIPALLHDIDYEAFPVNPEKISRLPYAIKPLSSIHRILGETKELDEVMKNSARLPPGVEKIVEKRNKKIGEAINEIEGSYNYARHIQNAFLPDSLFIRECFSDSFVLFKPKDIVSGDFYFFSRTDHKIVFAAADCTGHGIPGAMLSTIGYGILDQAVNELKITEPGEILRHLYSRIHRFLRKGTYLSGVDDDMDIALCSLDLHKNRLVWSGVGNPLYHITGSDFIEFKPGNIVDHSGRGDYEFTSENLKLRHGDVIYLYTDGYADQFGGSNHRRYQSGRLKETLMRISDYPMHEQGDILYEEIERWRGEKDEEQTDDILVIGIRV